MIEFLAQQDQLTPPAGELALLRWLAGILLAGLVYQHITHRRDRKEDTELRRADLKDVYGDMKERQTLCVGALERSNTMADVVLDFVKDQKR